MTLHGRMFKGTMALSTGQILSYGCAFVRNIILARILTKSDFGIAATFAITISALEMISNLSTDLLLIQAEDGNDPSLQGLAQLVQALCGLFTAALILMLAGPIAHLFQTPEALGAFRCLAVIPILKGFIHLDIHRFERRLRFGPSAAVEVIPQALITVAAWPLAAWLQDYSTLLWLLITKWSFTLIGAHLLADRPYRWSWSAQHAKRILVFGWPLLVNGCLMFGIMQGDRLIVGTGYTMADLGVYSVAAMLAMTPGMMILRVVGSLTLPLLSRVQDSPAEFRKRFSLCAQIYSLISAVFSVFLIIAGAGFIVLIYGEKYVTGGAFVGWLAVAQAIRVMRGSPTVAAVAKSDTKNLMISNIVRVSGLGLAVIAAARGADIVWIAIAGVFAEALAYIASTIRFSRLHGVHMGVCFGPGAITALAMGAAGLLAHRGISGLGLPGAMASAFMLSTTVIVAMLVLFKELRDQVRLVGKKIREKAIAKIVK